MRLPGKGAKNDQASLAATRSATGPASYAPLTISALMGAAMPLFAAWTWTGVQASFVVSAFLATLASVKRLMSFVTRISR